MGSPARLPGVDRSEGPARRRGRLPAGLALAGLLGLAGCGAQASFAPTTHRPSLLPAAALLRGSRARLGATPAVHFQLQSAGVPKGVTALVSGRGDLVRPAYVRGSMLVSSSGASATIKVLSVDGRFYVELPFTSRYTTADPVTYGLGDPAQLLDRTRGLGALLSAVRQPTLQHPVHLGGQLLDVVTGTVPGRRVPLLHDRDRSAPVTVTADIGPHTFQLRRLALRGPFAEAGRTTTYVLWFSAYGERVRVSTPPA